MPLNERLLVIGIVGLASVIPLILTIRYYVEVDFDPQLGALHVRRMFGKKKLVIPKAAILSIQHRGLPRNTTMRLRYKRQGKKDGVFYFTLKWGASDLLRQVNG